MDKDPLDFSLSNEEREVIESLEPKEGVTYSELIDNLKSAMEKMDDDQRIELLDDLFSGYCKECGEKEDNNSSIGCQCCNYE